MVRLSTIGFWLLRVFVSVAIFIIGVHYGRTHQNTHQQKGLKCNSAPSFVQVIDPCDDIGSLVSIPVVSQDELCHPRASNEWLFLHKNDVSKIKENSVLKQVFSQLHHPETPVKSELLLKQVEASDSAIFRKYLSSLPQEKVIPLPSSAPFGGCKSVYLTRSGSRDSMPNKCVAVVSVAAHTASLSFLSHRYGTQAKMVDQYVTDWATDKEYTDESVLLPLLLSHVDVVVAEFLNLMGPPLDAAGKRRSVFVMVANEGVMDLLLNFVCSCRSAGISLDNLVVFVGQREYRPLVQAMGAVAFYSPYLGSIPRKAADSYGDMVFAKLMWLKATSVYVAAKAGFNVLFQDADLVWLRDPVPYLLDHVTDIAFMDDGARTTRFTPLFVNSGFYYQKHSNKTRYLMEKMLKSAIEISATHSHQATLTHHLHESLSTFGLEIAVLPELLFPSGAQWHNNKKFIKALTDYKLHRQTPSAEPFVFHMCWTASRADKLTYLKELGMWYLPEKSESQCEDPKAMLRAVEQGKDLRKECCLVGRYIHGRPKN